MSAWSAWMSWTARRTARRSGESGCGSSGGRDSPPSHAPVANFARFPHRRRDMGKPFFITTAIDYTNGAPHIGHA